jgi:hypothetical protein
MSGGEAIVTTSTAQSGASTRGRLQPKDPLCSRSSLVVRRTASETSDCDHYFVKPEDMR